MNDDLSSPSSKRSQLAVIFTLGISLFSAAAQAQAVTHTVDGFKVTYLGDLPTKAKLPSPTSIVRPVEYTIGTNLVTFPGGASGGVDPFYMIPNLQNVTPYLSVQSGGSTTFSPTTKSTRLSILWGTPDTDNYISFYDSSGNLIGTLSGTDVMAAFGFSETSRPFPLADDFNAIITSPTAFTTFVISATGCCFEFSNIATK